MNGDSRVSLNLRDRGRLESHMKEYNIYVLKVFGFWMHAIPWGIHNQYES